MPPLFNTEDIYIAKLLMVRLQLVLMQPVDFNSIGVSSVATDKSHKSDTYIMPGMVAHLCNSATGGLDV